MKNSLISTCDDNGEIKIFSLLEEQNIKPLNIFQRKHLNVFSLFFSLF